jgi:uncharacterized membrane protein YtjA (UPF0391 family)
MCAVRRAVPAVVLLVIALAAGVLGFLVVLG